MKNYHHYFNARLFSIKGIVLVQALTKSVTLDCRYNDLVEKRVHLKMDVTRIIDATGFAHKKYRS